MKSIGNKLLRFIFVVLAVTALTFLKRPAAGSPQPDTRVRVCPAMLPSEKTVPYRAPPFAP